MTFRVVRPLPFESDLEFSDGRIVIYGKPTVLVVTHDQITRGIRTLKDKRWHDFDWRKGRISLRVMDEVRLYAKNGNFQFPTSGSALLLIRPNGTFYDFAIWEDDGGDVYQDPATKGAVEFKTNEGATPVTGISKNWRRISAGYYPPRGTTYVVPTFYFEGVQNDMRQYLDAIQVEYLRYETDEVSAYETPRSVTAVVFPARMNLCTKPQRTVRSNLLGRVEHALITGMLPEEQYVATAEIRAEDGNPINVTMEFGDDVREEGVIEAESGTEQGWVRIYARFFAYSRVDTLAFNCTAPRAYQVRNVLVERGDQIRPWFDGASGSDYVWETGMTPNVDANSLFYQDREKRHYLLRTSLRENVPVGLVIKDPEYGQNRTPYLSAAYGSGPYGAGTYGG